MPETLFLATALIDRYLAKAQVARKNLQLVRGQGAMAAGSGSCHGPPARDAAA